MNVVALNPVIVVGTTTAIVPILEVGCGVGTGAGVGASDSPASAFGTGAAADEFVAKMNAITIAAITPAIISARIAVLLYQR